jgi:hypothetical protein
MAYLPVWAQVVLTTHGRFFFGVVIEDIKIEAASLLLTPFFMYLVSIMSQHIF